MATLTTTIGIITVGRPNLHDLLGDLIHQETDDKIQILLILQGSFVPNHKVLPKNVSIEIDNQPFGKGFGFYRNRVVELAKGDVIAWIDDDERCQSNWIDEITSPIRLSEAPVVTSGTRVPLGYHYLTDSISLLGWPGGAAAGFPKVWNVLPLTKGHSKKNLHEGWTNHLCTGNFAISTELLLKLGGFNNEAHFGAEDNDLSVKISMIPNNQRPSILNPDAVGANILFKQSAEVTHLPRGIKELFPWAVRRGKAISSGKSAYEEPITNKLIRTIRRVLSVNRYLPGKLFVFGVFFAGTVYGKLQKRTFSNDT